ncbi:2-amino-4-hydroxy-6-hydroxymethyldihydropteridine diphosphokinase [Marinobacter sp. JSM 1782161]|uniref:2-amino-4-hydroxy-6- hydroxymethyldihydropteridine diphosphokinase n=1 Tax=Marinobacter sp. JSM 1782161 TaxID=2685906 RepID=UPI0014035791|nr:2-amino-4-hydroxy-6-hydroxymethyldihydropteridine diphosphokinase [Marinobacter sp. JSM 1782161]
MWYLCGLGSNIDPVNNLPRALDSLVRRLGRLRVSPVVVTRPQGIDTERDFFNALVVLQSPLPVAALKAWFNRIEAELGRDRSDPDSSRKDRPIDIDILEVSEHGPLTGDAVEEDYFRRLLEGRVRPDEVRRVALGDGRLGEATATVHWDHGTGHEIVVDQRQGLLDHTFETAFPGQ